MTHASRTRDSRIKAVCFDFMGTCLDWHTTIVSVLPSTIPEATRSQFALDWRQTYFDTNAAKIRDGKPTEDIDITHTETLEVMLDKHPDLRQHFGADDKFRAVTAWHHQKAWPDVAEAVRKLKHERGWEVFVYANGTTRLQLDLVRSSELSFDMLFSSELLGVYKPAPESYQKALKLLKHNPDEIVMVAAHAYDVRGAKEAGMKTVYIYRPTDDIHEDQEFLKTEFDAYLYDMTELDLAIAKL